MMPAIAVVRGNTGGIYTGIGSVTHKGTPLESTVQVMTYSRPIADSRGEPPSSARRAPSREAERSEGVAGRVAGAEGLETLPGFPCRCCAKYAYELTRKRNSKKKMLTLVHKCNVLTHAGDLWVRMHKEMGDKLYPEIKPRRLLPELAASWSVADELQYPVPRDSLACATLEHPLATLARWWRGLVANGVLCSRVRRGTHASAVSRGALRAAGPRARLWQRLRPK
jgi:3-isopropylmalate dehydrogenase